MRRRATTRIKKLDCLLCCNGSQDRGVVFFLAERGIMGVGLCAFLMAGVLIVEFGLGVFWGGGRADKYSWGR